MTIAKSLYGHYRFDNYWYLLLLTYDDYFLMYIYIHFIIEIVIVIEHVHVSVVYVYMYMDSSKTINR